MRQTLLVAALCTLPAIAMTPANAQECQMKLGAMGPMSGGGAQWGLAMKSAAELAAAEANQEGGVKINGKQCKVVVVPYDSKYTADGAAAGSNALAADGVHLIIGPVGSPEATGIKPLLGRNQQIAWNNAFAKNALEARFPLMFQISPTPYSWADPIIKKAKSVFNIKTVAIVAPNDQGGTDIGDIDADAYKANGITATKEYYQRGTTNFAPIVTRLLSTNPDVVDVASSPPGDAGVLIKQIRLAGFKGPVGRLGGAGTQEIMRVTGGPDVVQNFYWYEAVPVDDPKVKAIDDEYRKLLGHDPVGGTSVWGDLPAARLTLKAVNAAGTDDAKAVAAALRKLPVEDPNMGQGYWSGEKQYGIAQQLSFPFGIGIIKDGKNLGVERQPATHD
jgi:branched-chain amino acid transport system substrate-binding protein